MATIYKADGTTVETQPQNNEYFSLEELQAVVGGLIELVYMRDGKLMIINEEGKLLNLPYNERATEIYCKECSLHNAVENASFIAPDFIVGDVLICKDEECK